MVKKVLNLAAALNPLRLLFRLWFMFGNWRRGRFKKLDYVLFVLPAKLPALPEQRGWLRSRVLGAPPLSLWELNQHFERIAADPRPRGVILHLRGAELPLADLQSLRDSFLRLRAQGKQVVCYAQDYSTDTYYLASAADKIVIQPGGMLLTMGYSIQATFLKDALETAGIQLDVVAISPYKSAFDQVSRSDFSTESRQMVDWLLDSRYTVLLEGIAQGRGVPVETARRIIDTAPHLSADALAEGFIDGIVGEEGLAAFLGVKHVVLWDKANKVLLKRWRKRARQYVAVLRLAGDILPGESGKPPVDLPVPLPLVGNERMGDLTVVRQVRALLKDKNAAAVVLFVDSGGGSVSASEAMTAALTELAKTRPVVVYMNNVAASGGYYISTPARWIVAQPGTLTGSIGVLTAKPITRDLWPKLRMNRIELIRGENSTLFSDQAPFTDAQRAQMRRMIETIYTQFIGIVARSRNLDTVAVDAVAGGRVWTGAQAKQHLLIDELGDVHSALAKAREFAGLPSDSPARLVVEKGKPLAPALAEQTNPAAWWGYMRGQMQLYDGRPLLRIPFEIEN